MPEEMHGDLRLPSGPIIERGTDRSAQSDTYDPDLEVNSESAREIICPTLDEFEASNEKLKSTDEGLQFAVEPLHEAYSGEGQSTASNAGRTLTDASDLSQADRLVDGQSSQCSLAEIEQFYLSNPQAMALLSPDATFLRVNRQMSEISGQRIEDHIGLRMQDVVPDLSDEITRLIETVWQSGEPVLSERIEVATAERPNERCLFLTDWFPVRTNNELTAIGVNFRDIAEQSEILAERRRVMLELQHREKNILSNVSALVNRARRDADADACVLDALASRIKALSNTHKLMTEENGRATDIYALIEPELTAVYGSDRVHFAGPNLQLNARAAVALGMAVHELATNAAKHGAFSNDGGAVSLTWLKVDEGVEERVVFKWREVGGPTVKEVLGSGFGSQLLASTITGSLSGTLDVDWRAEGLRVEMAVPIDALNKMNKEVV